MLELLGIGAIKKGSNVNVRAVKARKPKNIRALHFDHFQGEKAIVVSVWKYPPHDKKFEVQILSPRSGSSESKRIVVRESNLEV
jgi:hypothetical protein